LGQHDRLLRRIGSLLSNFRLPSANYSPEATEKNKSNLRYKRSSFKKDVFLFVFAFLFFLSVTGGVLALRWPWQDRDPSFVAQWSTFIIFAIISQWSGIQFLQTLTGR